MSDQAYAHQTLIVKRSSKYGIPKKLFHCFCRVFSGEAFIKTVPALTVNSVTRPVFIANFRNPI